jgi:SAM-dependent methyltransferase
VSQPPGGAFGPGSVARGYGEYLHPVIFGPWAQRLVAYAGLSQGMSVLDVAAGTGAVSQAAAAMVGPEGSVIASDISAEMLSLIDTDQLDAAPISTLACSATALDLPAASVDRVLCQQGLQFIPDQLAAVGEMRRVLRPGGQVGLAVWQRGHYLHPFATYGDALESSGVTEPFPGAYDQDTFTMSIEEMASLLRAGGCNGVEVTAQDLTLQWPSPDAAVRGIAGTPFGPPLHGLSEQQRDHVMAKVRDAMSDGGGALRPQVMTAVLGRGTT